MRVRSPKASDKLNSNLEDDWLLQGTSLTPGLASWCNRQALEQKSEKRVLQSHPSCSCPSRRRDGPALVVGFGREKEGRLPAVHLAHSGLPRGKVRLFNLGAPLF